jgi:hypothetical protein
MIDWDLVEMLLIVAAIVGFLVLWYYGPSTQPECRTDCASSCAVFITTCKMSCLHLTLVGTYLLDKSITKGQKAR